MASLCLERTTTVPGLCGHIEAESGNDTALDSLKAQLEQMLGQPQMPQCLSILRAPERGRCKLDRHTVLRL